MRPANRKMSGKTKLFWLLLLLGFMFMEFPGVFFFKSMAEPYILGFPFIYGYILCCWVYMCVVVLIAYKSNWGEPVVEKTAEGGTNQ